MAYSVTSKKNGNIYYLHSRTTKTENGERVLRFFSKEIQEGALDEVPEGYVVTESETTGLPLLKRKK